MNRFIISLDFELYWGVRDIRGEEYFNRLKRVNEVIPRLLSLFDKYDVACTWATVGAICVRDYKDFIYHIPTQLPSYENNTFSPFNDLDYLSSIDNQILFAPNLVKLIKSTKNQEFASHTFSHFYALEQGQTIDEFEADLYSCKRASGKHGLQLKSLVFPRNQFNSEYLEVCKKMGFSSYRGNPSHWAYQAESRETRSILNRAFRLLDCYIPLSGSLRQNVKLDLSSGMVDVPASIFFRPYSHKLRFLDSLKLWRLKWSMTRTAKKGGVFHLWWHPHNFGQNMIVNLKQIEEILKHYNFLNKKYNFKSVTMEQAAISFLEDNA